MASRYRHKRVEIPAEMHVKLTENETRICELLDACTKYLRGRDIKTACRIAGGWVRDKLLGSHSNDVDVALTDMMGLVFANHLSEYAAQNGVALGTISKIAQNPDQSKHLETATVKIFDLDIDLVNLRSEEYASDSRIPTEVSYGTPEQDALRRDITINSLFYNIHTRVVEDWTQKGIHDLRNGIIRTPLPPQETFLDDPLRVLRCIRFASRYGFSIEEEVKDAARDPIIQTALVMKVARERIGTEIAKMMDGRDPLYSIELIHTMKLYRPIFAVFPGASQDLHDVDVDTSLSASAVLRILLDPTLSPLPHVHPLLMATLSTDSTSKARLYLASALTPFKELKYPDKKGKKQNIVELVVRESLKLGTQNHFLDGIPPLFEAALALGPRLADPQSFTEPSERVSMGLLLRDKIVHNSDTGSHWTTSLLFSLVQDLVHHYDTAQDRFDEQAASQMITRYNSFVARVEYLKLVDVADAKPLLNGREIIQLFGRKSGPWVGQILSSVVAWQLEHPEKTSKECIEWLKRNGEMLQVEEKPLQHVSKRLRTD